MPNIERECSSYEYSLSHRQFVALMEIALKKDSPIDQLVLEAIDEYLAREKQCGTK
jgi:hypothetical protein